MGTYLRISNRGTCPRLMLEILGATDKRSRFSDLDVIGLFGSGTKFAPVAAKRLDIGISFTSHDERGPYFIRYGAEECRIGQNVFERLLLKYHNGPDVPHPVTTMGCYNWDKPIGADDKKTFRVLREYLCNARDEDADFDWYKAHSDKGVPFAPEGTTSVYLTWHDEFEEMLRQQPDRYFKWLSGVQPLFAVPGIGAIYPKSEADKTRLFSQGTMAYCARQEVTGSLYDWSVDQKSHLSEDREYRDVVAAYVDFNKLLCRLDIVALAGSLLVHVVNQPASLEQHAFGMIGHLRKDEKPASADTWLAAWKAVFGEDAILATEHDFDEIARFSFRKRPVSVPRNLHRFLVLCGLKESKDFAATAKAAPQWQEVEADEIERARLDYVLDFVRSEVPAAEKFDFFLYEPLTAEAKIIRGLTFFGTDGKPTGRIGLQRAIVLSYTDLTQVILHELDHALIPTNQHGLDFVRRSNVHRAKLFMEKHDIPEEPSVELGSPAPQPPKKRDIDSLRERLNLPKKK